MLQDDYQIRQLQKWKMTCLITKKAMWKETQFSNSKVCKFVKHSVDQNEQVVPASYSLMSGFLMYLVLTCLMSSRFRRWYTQALVMYCTKPERLG